ncbi:IS3 family transposase [Saccharopolyspora sp. NPDC049426]|uniref:IS3 family transposase n=1 Tax=Saccharopolyspora sp. NPDC049426 TaxID=3155652 RepID=UPI003440591C
MPRPYPPEFRYRAVALVRAGKSITTVATELDINAGACTTGSGRDQIDPGERSGNTTHDSAELTKANRSIRKLEAEVEILRKAVKLLGNIVPPHKGSSGDRFSRRRGHPVKVCCRVLGVSSPGYYQYKNRPMSPTMMRRQCLTGLIREVHDASCKTHGSRRVHAELTRGMGIVVSVNLVGELMRLAGIVDLPGPVKIKRLKGVAPADALVHRKVHRLSTNELWVTDITEHPTRVGGEVLHHDRNQPFGTRVRKYAPRWCIWQT